MACGPASPEAKAPPPHAHHGHSPGHHGHAGGQHGQGPLVHRFGEAAEWSKEFDNPERDAWQKPAEIVALLQISPGMKVADIGAGTGYFEPHLSRAAGPSGKVLALDVEDGMVRHMQERMTRENLTNVAVAKVPFEDPQLPAGGVDRVLIVDTWHHISGREAYAAKLFAGLAPGGFVAVVDFTPEAKHGPPVEHRVPAEQTRKELASSGLTAEIATETLPEQYVVIGRKPAK